MEAIFQRLDNVIKPSAETKVVKIADKDLCIKASDLLAQAEARAAQILQEAEEVYALRKQEGYEAGMAEVKLEHAEKILETILSSVSFIENIEQSIVEVVIASIHKVLGAYDKEELVSLIVQKALSTMRSQQKVLLRVCPDDEEAVKKALGTMLSKEGSGFVDVLSDIRLKPTSCILESELGIIDASLDVQLQALEQALRTKVAPE